MAFFSIDLFQLGYGVADGNVEEVDVGKAVQLIDLSWGHPRSRVPHSLFRTSADLD